MGLRRVIAFDVAVLAFALAAVGPDGVQLFGALPERRLRSGRMTSFWLGVVLTLAAAWGRGN
jgi:hypothetical protein